MTIEEIYRGRRNYLLILCDGDEDLLHDSFLNALEKEDLKKTNGIQWIKTIIRHKKLDYIKHQKVVEKYIDHTMKLSRYHKNNALDTVSIPKLKREPFELHYVYGLRHKEIAEQLEITETMSKNRTHSALKLFKKLHSYEV